MTAPQMMAACPKYNERLCRGCDHSVDHADMGVFCRRESQGSKQKCPACTPLPVEPEQAKTWADDEPRNVHAEPEKPRPTARERIEAELEKMLARGYAPSHIEMRTAAERVIDQDARVIEGLREELKAARKQC